MATRTINGSRLELFDEGSGEPVVLVHGSASDHRTWQAQREPFAERFRVISYSRRYHWPNEPIPDGVVYGMPEHVDDLAALLRAVDAGPVHLVGHSYGGFLCLLLAMREPELVRTLVVAEPPVVTLFVSDPPKPLELLKVLVTRPRTAAAIVKFGALGVEPAKKAFRRGDVDKGVETFAGAVFGSGGFAGLPEERRSQVLDNITNVRAEILGSGFAPLRADELRGIDIPTLLLTGERSIPLFHRLADRVEELLPQVERAEVPGGSHMMHEDNPSAFNEAVLSFLGLRARAADD